MSTLKGTPSTQINHQTQTRVMATTMGIHPSQVVTQTEVIQVMMVPLATHQQMTVQMVIVSLMPLWLFLEASEIFIRILLQSPKKSKFKTPIPLMVPTHINFATSSSHVTFIFVIVHKSSLLMRTEFYSSYLISKVQLSVGLSLDLTTPPTLHIGCRTTWLSSVS